MSKISSFHLFCILFVCRLLGTFTYMSQLQTTLHAGSRIASAALCFVFSIIGALPVLLLLRNQPNTSFLTAAETVSIKSSRVFGICYTFVFLFSAVITLTRFGLFAGTVLLQNAGLYIAIFFLLTISIYCVQQGLQALSKTAVIFAILICASLLTIILGNVDNWQFINISAVQTNEISQITKQAFLSACRNIEIPAVLFIADQIQGKLSAVIVKFLATFSGLSVLLFTLAGGVLGEYGEQQIFPLFTLSSIADIGIFEHMEDLLTGIWIVCAMLKTAFLLYVASKCLQKATKKEGRLHHNIISGCLIFAGFLLFSHDIPTSIRLLSTWLLPAGFILFAFLIPCIFYILISRKEKKLRKENKK